MDTFFNGKFKRIFSLGSNCYPKIFISKILKSVSKETDFFDYVGTSMWSINSLLLNDFAGIDDHKNFVLMPVLEGGELIVVNTKYYLRFKHDLSIVADATRGTFKAKLARRLKRFTDGLTADSILFIRHEESQTGRLPYTSPNALRSDAEELEEFIDILHMKYNCKNVVVIYINLNVDGWNERHNILSVKIDSLDYDSKIADTVIKELFEKKGVMDLLG
jgi:hypothetical protein